MRSTTRAVLVAMLAMPLPVFAQPGTVDPSTQPVGLAAPLEPLPAYPRELIERPLVLPTAALEVTVGIAINNDSRRSFAPEVRYATSIVELQLGLAYQVSDRPSTDAELRILYIGAKREIIPCRARNLVAGVQLAARTPGDLPSVEPTLLVAYKRAFDHIIAIDSLASIGYVYGNVRLLEAETSTHQLDASVHARIQLQLGTATAVEGHGALLYRSNLESYTAYGSTSFGSQQLGLALVIAATTNIDLRASYVANLRSGDNIGETIFLGMSFRRI